MGPASLLPAPWLLAHAAGLCSVVLLLLWQAGKGLPMTAQFIRLHVETNKEHEQAMDLVFRR